MTLGIVGSEAAKFTPETEQKARDQIRELFRLSPTDLTVISGGCHLGGIDIWTIEEAKSLGFPTQEFKPRRLCWDEYKRRNLLIAENSDLLVCITVKTLPPNYRGMRFSLCYHCGTSDHVKSGGCWTMKQAKKLGKQTKLIVIE